MIILASEDVGNADPRALQIAVAAFQAFECVGLPEGFLPLAHAAIYLAAAPKSNAVYMAYKDAQKRSKNKGVPSGSIAFEKRAHRNDEAVGLRQRI